MGEIQPSFLLTFCESPLCFRIKIIIPSCLPFVSLLSLLLEHFYSWTCLPFVSDPFLLHGNLLLQRSRWYLFYMMIVPSSFLLNPLLRSFSLPFVWEVCPPFLFNPLLIIFSLPFIWEILFNFLLNPLLRSFITFRMINPFHLSS